MTENPKVDEKSYLSVSVHPGTFAELLKMKKKKAAQLGITSLSWNDYFQIAIRDEKQRGEK